MPDIERQLFQNLCDAMPLGVCLVDMAGKIIYWNSAAEAITGYLSQEVLGRSYREDLLIECTRYGGIYRDVAPVCPVRAVLRDGRAASAEVYLRHKDGSRIHVYVDAMPLRDSMGDLKGAAQFMNPLQENQEYSRRPAYSGHDLEPPAEVAEPGQCREHLQTLLHSTSASSSAAILIELDSHHAILQHGGTAMLHQSIRVLLKTVTGLLPPGSHIGRWSDDKLVILIPHCGHQTLEELQAKLIEVGSSCAVKWWGDRMRVELRAASRYLDPALAPDALIRSLVQNLDSANSNGER